MRKFVFLILIIFILISCRTKGEIIEEPKVEPPVILVVIEPVEEIEIIEPEFDIISIVILQADIVVTEFEATLRIKNPNGFAVELSSITYELYGNGQFWADGTENDILHIPAQSSEETKFIFKMNFIDMSRRLLDDVIAMRQINYRFRGQALMKPLIPNTSSFLVNFDCFGLSEVKQRAN